MELSDEIKEDEMERACGMYVGEEECIQAFGGKPKGRRPLARPRTKWEDINKKDLTETGWEGTDWIHMAQDMD
jgi:hypothetical protein